MPRAVSLAQPEQGRTTTPANPQLAVQGEFEYLNQEALVLSFQIPNFVGTPIISLVSPTKALAINALCLDTINDQRKESAPNLSLRSYAETVPMFYTPLVLGPPRLRAVTGNTVHLTATGTGFVKGVQFFINDQPVTSATYVTSAQYDLQFPMITGPHWTLRAVETLGTVQAHGTVTIDNPAMLRITQHEIVAYWKKTENSPAQITLQLSGTGFASLPADIKINVQGGAIVGSPQLLLTTGELLVTATPTTDTPVILLTNGGATTLRAIPLPKEDAPKPQKPRPQVAPTLLKVSKGSAKAISLKGTALAGIKAVKFGDTSLPFHVEKDELIIALTRDVTKEAGDVRLRLELDEGFVPVTMTVTP